MALTVREKKAFREAARREVIKNAKAIRRIVDACEAPEGFRSPWEDLATASERWATPEIEANRKLAEHLGIAEVFDEIWPPKPKD